MQNSENKKVVENNKVETTKNAKDEKNLSALLDKFKDEKKSASAKNSIYKNADYLKKSEKDKRKFRKDMRKQLLKVQIPAMKECAIHYTQKKVNEKELKEQFNKFNSFYVENYSVNDFSISSMYGGEIDSYEYEYVKNFLQILKELNLIK